MTNPQLKTNSTVETWKPFIKDWKHDKDDHSHNFYFNTVFEFLTIGTRQEKETKGIQIEKEEVNLPLFTDDMTLYMK